MFTKKAILTVLFVMVTGAMAADKPAVEARLKMEAEAQGKTEVNVTREQTGVIVAREQPVQAQLGWHDGTTKPAVAALRRGKEAPVGAKDTEHSVADAGYNHPIVDAGFQRMQAYEVPNVDMGTKPAVRARQQK